jgi:hypothetical protein
MNSMFKRLMVLLTIVSQLSFGAVAVNAKPGNGPYGAECFDKRFGTLTYENGTQQQLLPDCNLLPYQDPFVNAFKGKESWRLFNDSKYHLIITQRYQVNHSYGTRYNRDEGSSEIDMALLGDSGDCKSYKAAEVYSAPTVRGFVNAAQAKRWRSIYPDWNITQGETRNRCASQHALISTVRPGIVQQCRINGTPGKEINSNGEPQVGGIFANQIIVQVGQRNLPFPYLKNPPKNWTPAGVSGFAGQPRTWIAGTRVQGFQYDVYVHVNDMLRNPLTGKFYTLVNSSSGMQEKVGACKFFRSRQQYLQAGEPLTLLGASGAYGAHLHLETWICNFDVYRESTPKKKQFTLLDSKYAGGATGHDGRTCVWARPYWSLSGKNHYELPGVPGQRSIDGKWGQRQ